MENSENTPIGRLGKFGLLSRISERAHKMNSSTVLGIGDDAAVIDNGSQLTLVSTDLLLEGIHFNLIYTPLKHLGYKAVIRGISDIYAMNGRPVQVMIALGVSSRFTVEQVDEIYEGIRLACEKYNVDLAGGDLTSSVTGLTISVTATGNVSGEQLVKRNGAGGSDLICVTGDFGASYAGLQVLERERRLFEKEKSQPVLSGYEYVVGRQLRPDLPIKSFSEINNAGLKMTSLIDVSDGLASDLMHICRQSMTGCRIYAEKIPVDYETAKVADELGIDPVTMALNGGEDYEFVFTLALSDFTRISGIGDVKVIGHMTSAEEGYVLVGSGGSEINITAQGWQQSD